VLEGTKAIPIPSRYCDVRDVARAHILAAEVPGANGRYMVSHVDTVPSKFVSDSLQVPLPVLRTVAGGTRHTTAGPRLDQMTATRLTMHCRDEHSRAS